MKIDIGFGMGTLPLEIKDENLLGVLVPNEITKSDLSEKELVDSSLDNPIGSKKIEEIVKPGEKVVIVTSDITRPLPTYKLLPSVLERLTIAGADLKDVTVVFALGSHRVHTEEEKKKLLGDSYGKINTIDGMQQGYVSMGTTKHGTPVDICKVVAEADRRICLGNIEYHYFAGYSGGAKAIMPGVSTREAIQSNHSLMTAQGAVTGNLATNPLRKDLEEAIGYCPIDFIVNVVLSETKEIVHCVAGDFITAHREGCKFLDSLYRKEITDKADIVVVSQGGAPKDLNLYQTQKALDNAKHAVKDGGIIILVGSCKEGLGEHVFEEWMLSAQKPADLVARIQKDFKLGGHKAAAIAMVQENADIYMVSEMDDTLVNKLFMTPLKDLQTAYDKALAVKGESAKTLIMPYGGSTLPTVKQ